jgi:hypothetical protein
MINYNLAEQKEVGVGDFKHLMRAVITLHVTYMKNLGFEKKQIASIISTEMEDIAAEMRATLK